MFPLKLKAFTLVELIVVISVLSVLATIAFTQIGSITSGARDSQRLTDISSMKSSLENYMAQKGMLPAPTNGSGVAYSGWVVWTQGVFGDSVVMQLKSISPKPVDPKYWLEYVYSVANNGKEYEIAGILEKSVGLNPIIQTAQAATAQNVTEISGNYNGISLKVITWSLTYVLAVPTLIAGDIGDGVLANVKLVIDGQGSLPKWFSGSVIASSSVQTGTFTPIVAWSGSALPSTTATINAMVQGIQSAYAASNYATNTQIAQLLAVTGSTALTNYGNGLLSTGLGGTAVATSQYVNGACGSIPSNALYANSGTTYSLANAPIGTSLSAVTAGYSASPASNTCQWRCSDTYGYSGTNCVAITSLVPTLSSNTSASPIVVSATTAHWNSDLQPWKAFNKDASSWQVGQCFDAVTGDLVVDFGSTKTVSSYKVRSRDDAPESSYRAWTFDGSTNNSTWVTLSTLTNETPWTAGQIRTYTITPASYRYFRWHVTANTSYVITCSQELEIWWF